MGQLIQFKFGWSIYCEGAAYEADNCLSLHILVWIMLDGSAATIKQYCTDIIGSLCWLLGVIEGVC